jgi:molybdopterin/thiamine biosynthesis adenylyltransferase
MIELNKVLQIGSGGCGNYTMPYLVCSVPELIIADGDTYEDKNLTRQPHAITGMNKAEAAVNLFKDRYPTVAAHPHMVTGDEEFTGLSLIISCVDSNHGRVAAKALADAHKVPLIICQNDVRDAEAYLYLPELSGTLLDPYKRHGLATLQEAQAPCDGVIVEQVEQTAYSNMVSAGAGCLILQSLIHEEEPDNYVAEVRCIPLPQTKKFRHLV